MKDLENMQNEYGSRVVLGGKKCIIPIRTREEMDSVLFQSETMDPVVRSYITSVEKMDEEWKCSVRKNFWWGKEEHEPGIDERLYSLRDRLLTFGGESVCLTFGEPDVDAIMALGQLWHGYGAKRARGRMSRCHHNAAELWKEKGYRVCTGYALSDDGMWRQHSWCIDKRPRTTKIIETTEPRVLYFGYVLNDEETKSFIRRLYG